MKNIEERLNIKVEEHILDFVKNHSKSESLLYNNNCFAMYINPTEERKIQYNINRDFILSYFDFYYWMKQVTRYGECFIILDKTQLHQTKPFGYKEISFLEYIEIKERLNN